MFLRSLWSLCTNTTTIESWEIERHQTLLRRSMALGGYLEGADGIKVWIRRQEFPYDIGIWNNIVQGLCGGPVTWLWPFARSYPMTSGLSFEINGFEGRLLDLRHCVHVLTPLPDPSVMWPPPDPDRIPRKAIPMNPNSAFIHPDDIASNQEHLEAFRKRQAQDWKRYQVDTQSIQRRQPFHKRYEGTLPGGKPGRIQGGLVNRSDGEEAWKNSEGDRLDDFGVDETVEFYDEDDIPLAELLLRRSITGSAEER